MKQLGSINKSFRYKVQEKNDKVKRHDNARLEMKTTKIENEPSPYEMFKKPKKMIGQSKPNNNSSSLSLSSIITPTHSVFEKKIREAIQIRYQRSHMKDFKYKRNKDSNQSALKLNQYQKYSAFNDESDSSQLSQEMYDIQDFAYLKNLQCINIHQFHSSKNRPKQYNGGYRNRVIRNKPINKESNTFDNQNQQDTFLVSQINKSISKDRKEELKSPNKNQFIGNQQFLFPNSKPLTQDKFSSKQYKIKSLTSRQVNHQIVQNQNDNENKLQLQEKKLMKTKNQIKDTFKLKYPNKLLNKRQNKEPNNSVCNISFNELKTEKSDKNQKNEKNKTRRYLYQRNPTKQINLKTQPSDSSAIDYRTDNIVRDISGRKQKITSLRKIETQFIEPNINQGQIYNKTAQNKAKMVRNYRNNNFLVNRLKQTSQKNIHASSQKRWKLEEISFRFKPVDEIGVQQGNEDMMQSKKKALKLGLSIQKAYCKLLEYKPKTIKQNKLLHNKAILNSKAEGGGTATDIINEQSQSNNKERSISKNKRRVLRVATQNDQSVRMERNESRLGRNESANKLQVSNRQSKQSLGKQREKFEKNSFLSQRKKQEGDRFSTIN